jgi:hypothetical protein
MSYRKVVEMNKEQIKEIIINEMVSIWREQAKETAVPTKMFERSTKAMMPGLENFAERASLKIVENIGL